MENNHKHISQNEFKAYLAGKMSAQEKAAFEQRVQNDPFAQEALEGFEGLENYAKAIELINNESKIIAEKSGFSKNSDNKTVPLFRMIAIAASLIFVVGGVLFSYQLLQNNNQLAETSSASEETVNNETENRRSEKKVASENEVLFNDSFVEEEVVGLTEKPKEIVSKKIDLEQVGDTKVEDNAPEKSIAKVSKNQLSETPAPPVFTDALNIEQEEIYESLGSINNSKEAPRAASTSKAEVQSDAIVSVSKSNYNNGYEKFQEGNFDQAVVFFNESIKNQEKVIESNYYLGMSLYYQKKYNKAIKSYDNVINAGSNGLVNNAKWYKANALIELGKKSDAKIILEGLVKSNSSFKTQAQSLLNNF